MKALRITLHQNIANYRKAETVDNKMTYPLPPPSTVIGALHVACGYTEYHEMDVSIQGKYGSMQNKCYVDHCFLNNVSDDRGMLVKLHNPNAFNANYIPVASAMKSQGNSFRKGNTINIHDNKILNEYRELLDIQDRVKEEKKTIYNDRLEMYKNRKKDLKEKKKEFNKKSEEYKKICEAEKALELEEKNYKKNFKEYENESYKKPLSYFASLQKSVKNYELLTDVELVIHVRADNSTIDDILENIYNLQSIGRSEDFVDVKEAIEVDLTYGEGNNKESYGYSMYLNYQDLKDEIIFTGDKLKEHEYSGTLYFFGKKYIIEKGKRTFPDKKRIIYASGIGIDEAEGNVYLDHNVATGEGYIVNFI